MSWKVPVLAVESYCHGQKVGNLSQRQKKIQLPLRFRGAKAAALFSMFGTDKQILFAKQVFEFQDHCAIEFCAQCCRICASFVSRRLDLC